jgi:hypothetical protein
MMIDVPEIVATRFAELVRETPHPGDDLTGCTVEFCEEHGRDALRKLELILIDMGNRSDADWLPEAVQCAARCLQVLAMTADMHERLTGKKADWAVNIIVDRLRPSMN